MNLDEEQIYHLIDLLEMNIKSYSDDSLRLLSALQIMNSIDYDKALIEELKLGIKEW